MCYIAFFSDLFRLHPALLTLNNTDQRGFSPLCYIFILGNLIRLNRIVQYIRAFI